MGTKRYLAPLVVQLIDQLPDRGRVVDLFCGTGAVTAALQHTAPVVMNDASTFLGPFMRARFTLLPSVEIESLIARLASPFRTQTRSLLRAYGNRVELEERAVGCGVHALQRYMEHAPHVGSSASCQVEAQQAKNSSGSSRYQLMTLYFSAGYVSTRQAIELDAIRYAVDTTVESHHAKHYCHAAMTITLDRILNAPGHSAQFLKPKSEPGLKRIRQTWSKSAWDTFREALRTLEPIGSKSWRSMNSFTCGDALELISGEQRSPLRAFYADPPYTDDQYSRYYHVHETYSRYDFPSSTGLGRYRDNRFASAFSLKSKVEGAFRTLFAGCVNSGTPLVLSYPPDGLLTRHGGVITDLMADYFNDIEINCIETTHSTLGASKGQSSNRKIEHVYVCKH
jgi:adenine-specific DNA-methyltransferase